MVHTKASEIEAYMYNIQVNNSQVTHLTLLQALNFTLKSKWGLKKSLKKMNSNSLLQESFHDNLKPQSNEIVQHEIDVIGYHNTAVNWRNEKIQRQRKMIAVKQACRNVKRNP